MIKKTLQAIFEDGDYKGTYDWKGGIPLSQKETIDIHINNKTLSYVLVEKTVDLFENGEDQDVKIVYYFKLK